MGQVADEETGIEEAPGNGDMNRLVRNGWKWSELIEEWDYRYQERLGLLAGLGLVEQWMDQLASQEAQDVIERLVAETNC